MLPFGGKKLFLNPKCMYTCNISKWIPTSICFQFQQQFEAIHTLALAHLLIVLPRGFFSTFVMNNYKWILLAKGQHHKEIIGYRVGLLLNAFEPKNQRNSSGRNYGYSFIRLGMNVNRFLWAHSTCAESELKMWDENGEGLGDEASIQMKQMHGNGDRTIAPQYLMVFRSYQLSLSANDFFPLYRFIVSLF